MFEVASLITPVTLGVTLGALGHIRVNPAVLVDGAYTKNEKGELVYQDRSKEQLDRIATLVEKLNAM